MSRRTPATFGANLRRERLKAKLTQEELKDRLGFRRTTPISIWERGNHIPEPKTIVKLATAIGCSPAALLRGVITPYDALRGHRTAIRRTGPAPGTPAPTIESLSEQEIALLTLARQLPRRMVASHLALMEGEIRLLARGKSDGILGAVDARFRLAGKRTLGARPADSALSGT